MVRGEEVEDDLIGREVLRGEADVIGWEVLVAAGPGVAAVEDLVELQLVLSRSDWFDDLMSTPDSTERDHPEV